MRVDRNIRLLEAHAILTNLMFVIPVIVPFYRERMGLSFNDFLLGEAAFALTIVLFDVPSGWFSDQWKRKNVLALASAVEFIGFVMMLNAQGLAMALASQAVIGVAMCLLSGTNTAMLYETLMATGREGEYRRHEGRRAGFGLYSIAGASAAGGFAYAADPRLPVLLTLGALAAACVTACLMEEPGRHCRRPEKHPVLDALDTARYALAHPEAGFLLVFAALMFCSTKSIMWSQQPYYMALGLKEDIYGILMSVGFLLGGVSSHMAHRLDGRVNTRRMLALTWAAAVAVCLGAAAYLGWPGVALLMAGGTCLYGIAAPRVNEAVNRCVDSARRATVLSTQSLLTSLAFIPLSRLTGGVFEARGIQASLVALAAWLCLAGLCLLGWAVRRGRIAALSSA